MKKNNQQEKRKPRNDSLKEKRIGTAKIMKCGEIAIVREYLDNSNIIVEFPNCRDEKNIPITKKTTWANYDKGCVAPSSPDNKRKYKKSISRTGTIYSINDKETALITECRNARDMDIVIKNDKNKTIKTYKNVRFYDFINGRLTKGLIPKELMKEESGID